MQTTRTRNFTAVEIKNDKVTAQWPIETVAQFDEEVAILRKGKARRGDEDGFTYRLESPSGLIVKFA